MTFLEAYHNDTTVHHLCRRGATPEEIVGHLAWEKKLLIDQIFQLESLRPRQIVLDAASSERFLRERSKGCPNRHHRGQWTDPDTGRQRCAECNIEIRS